MFCLPVSSLHIPPFYKQAIQAIIILLRFYLKIKMKAKVVKLNIQEEYFSFNFKG